MPELIICSWEHGLEPIKPNSTKITNFADELENSLTFPRLCNQYSCQRCSLTCGNPDCHICF